MMSKSSRAVKLLFLILFSLVPLIFTRINSELFEIPKIYTIYSISTLILLIHLLNFFNGSVPLYKKSLLNLILLIFVSSQIISTFFSVDLHTSIFGYYSRLNGGLLSTLVYITLFFILPVYLDSDFFQKLIKVSIFSAILVASYGFLQHFGIDKHLWVQDVQSRVFSSLGQPNWLAAYLCIVLPFSFSLSLSNFPKQLPKSIFYTTVSLLFFTTLLFTKSKSGIIAAIISLGIFFFIYFLNQLKSKSNLIFLFSYLIVLAALSLSFNNPIKDFLIPTPSPQQISTSDNDTPLLITPSQDIRKIVWQGAIQLWRRFPLVGTGPETFAYTYYWTRPASHNLTSEWDFLYNKAHNEYLNYLATTGSFGLVTYSVFILAVLIYLFNSLRHNPQNYNYAALLSAFISILITNYAGFSISIISLYFFLIPAFIPTPQETPPKQLKSWIKWPLIIISFVFLSKLQYYFLTSYLADITYTKAENQNNLNQLSLAKSNINLSLGYLPSEPLYHSLKAQILAKEAIVLHGNDQQADLSQLINQIDYHSQKSIQISPTNINLLKQRAETYYYLSTIDIKYLPYSIASLIQASKFAPTDAKTQYLLGKFWQSAGNDQEALSAYLEAIKLKPNYDYAYFAAAQIYLSQKDYPQAKDFLQKTLQIAPANSDAKQLLEQIP